MQIDFDAVDAVERIRFDVLNVIHVRRSCSFTQGRDALSHLLGRQPVIGPDDANHRNVDGRENILCHLECTQTTSDQEQEAEHSKRIG
jgi:hypothetical protein